MSASTQSLGAIQFSQTTNICSKFTNVILDADIVNSSLLVKTGGSNAFYIDKYGNAGFNTTSPGAQIEVASSNGSCMRMRYGASEFYADMFLSNTGDISINASAGDVKTNASLNLVGHDGATIGLKLAGTLVTATANQINYNVVTPGTASVSKALVLDSSGSISSINSLSATSLTGQLQTPAQPNITSVGTLTSLTVSGTTELQTKLAAIYGGTDNDTYTTSDMLVASSSTTLAKVSVPPAVNGCFLVADTASPNGVGWSMNVLYNYQSMGDPVYNSNTNYTMPYFVGRNAANTNFIQIGPTTIDLTTNGINGLIPPSANLTGVIYPDPISATLTGTSSAFTTELVVGDLINISGDTRKVLSITNDTTLGVDSPFALLNRWSFTTATISTTQKKFGISALNVAGNRGYALNTVGSGYGFDATGDSWTIEMFVYLSAVNGGLSVCSSTVGFSFSLAFSTSTDTFTISLGQGTAFNIANATIVTGDMIADTWYHVAVVYSGTDYRVFFNGTLGATIASAAKITATAFHALRFGSNTVTNFNGYIDEARISDIARYSTAFTPTTIAFTSDVNTVSLQHFDNATITLGDDKSTSENTFTFTKNGSLYSGALNYVYALNHPTTPAYIVSNRPSIATLVDLPAGYSNLDCALVSFVIPIQANNVPYSVFNTGHHCSIVPMPLIINTSTNTTPITYSLASYIPVGCKTIYILITHTHVGTLSTGIQIGPIAALYQTFAVAAVTGQSYMMATIPILSERTIDANLTVLASTTSFKINLVGFYF